MLSIPGVEGSQGGRIQFSDASTEPVIEDASAQALDADKVLSKPTGSSSKRLGQWGDRVLEGENGIALEDIARVLPGGLTRNLAGFPFPISDQLHLPQRHAANDCPAEHHPDEAQHRLPHPLPPTPHAQAHHARLQAGRKKVAAHARPTRRLSAPLGWCGPTA